MAPVTLGIASDETIADERKTASRRPVNNLRRFELTISSIMFTSSSSSSGRL